MIKKIISYSICVISLIISVNLYFKDILENYFKHKYAKGGTAYTTAELISDFKNSLYFGAYSFIPILLIIVCFFCFLAFSLSLKKKTIFIYSFVFSSIHFIIIIIESDGSGYGEGIEYLLILPLLFILTIIQIIIFFNIVIKLLNTSLSYAIYFYIINTVIITFLIYISYGYESKLIISFLISLILGMMIFIGEFDEENERKRNAGEAILAVISFFIIGLVTFNMLYTNLETVEKNSAESKGYIYVGNDGKEKERASFNCDGYTGYYAYRVDNKFNTDYIEYRKGDYCIVEGYDFSSGDIHIKRLIGGKQAIYTDSFTYQLAKNKSKIKSLTADSDTKFIIKNNCLYDRKSESIIYLCLNCDKKITIPSNIERIREYAYADLDIREINFEDKCMCYRGAFKNCKITNLDLPESFFTPKGVFGDEEDSNILGNACELKTINIKPDTSRCSLGYFDENVRQKNVKNKTVLTIKLNSGIYIENLGTMIYNYEEINTNIYYPKERYLSSYAYNKDKLESCKNLKYGDKGSFTLSYRNNGKLYYTKVNYSYIS